jgi:NADH-quinone oxidoreductase subunit L
MTPSHYFLAHLWLIPLFPLLTAALILLLGRFFSKEAVSFFCVGSVFLSFVYVVGASFVLFSGDPDHRVYQQVLFEWVTPGAIPADGGPVPFLVDWGYLLDPLSCVMILVVTGIGFLVHIYSIGYMSRERGYYRFFGYMNLFLSSMLILVLANNLLLLFVGWEGVALCSYLLISFYFEKKYASAAATRAFLVNVLADAGLLLGIFYVGAAFGTLRFTSHDLSDPIAYAGIQETLAAMFSVGRLPSETVFIAIALLLFIGAIGKSAQFPLSAWLPDTMEAPLPVSALLHSVTVVAAGVYLLARMNAVYWLAPFAMDIVAAVGTLTAILAAFMALVQTDMKKVLAYSTISQLGYTYLALGVGAFSAGVFHLMTHAFFKSLLFLCAGSVIHALSGEHDLRKMGGLWNTVPATSRPFLIATLAIVGMPPLAGFFSGSETLSHVFGRSAGIDRYLFLWIVALITTGLTSFYMFRMLFLAFFGRSRVPPELDHHLHESPKAMTVPLVVLAAGSIVVGWSALPILWGDKSSFEEFLGPVVRGIIPETAVVNFRHHSVMVEWFLMGMSIVVALTGLWFAYGFYIKNPQRQSKAALARPHLHNLLLHTLYLDELYAAVFVNRLKDLGTACALFDEKGIDGLAIDGTAWLLRSLSKIFMWWDKWVLDGLVGAAARFTRGLSHPLRLFQSGVLSTYAVFILVGLTLLLAYYGHHMYSLVRSLR